MKEIEKAREREEKRRSQVSKDKYGYTYQYVCVPRCLCEHAVCAPLCKPNKIQAKRARPARSVSVKYMHGHGHTHTNGPMNFIILRIASAMLLFF